MIFTYHFPLNIVITHYDDTFNLIKTLESIHSQTFSYWRVHIVDAGTLNLSCDISSFLVCPNIHLTIIPNIGIYEGMNLGIRNVPYGEMYQIMNAGTIYTNSSSLNAALTKVRCLSSVYICGAQVINLKSHQNSLYSSKFAFPYNVFHEACIYPTLTNTYHQLNRGVSADIFFIVNISSSCKSTKFIPYPLISYPKGGKSDLSKYAIRKIYSYFDLIFFLLFKFQFYPCSLYTIRILKDLILLVLKKL